MSLLRKLTTRPVWKWEKSRPYPIRQRWPDLPAVPATGALPLVILTTPTGFDDAMWAAWSWLRFVGPDVRFELVVDGEPTAEQRAALERLSPGARMVTRRELLAETGAWPDSLRSFVEHHPLGRKLALTLLYQQRGRVLYLDSDIIAFNDPRELREAFRAPDALRFMLESDAGNWDPLILEAGRTMRLAPRHGLNSGLLLLGQGSLDLHAAARLVEARSDAASWFTEQTVLALLMPPGAQPLPPNRYVISTQRQFYWEKDVDYDAIAVRHFTGPTRHVMYLKGLPILERAARREGFTPYLSDGSREAR
jgi:hypothetical protein